jgi:hypothetical protein
MTHVCGLSARVGKICYSFLSWEEVSDAYLKLVSVFPSAPPCEIVNLRGEVIGHVTGNGRVWPGRPRHIDPDSRPIYEPI